jgi:hypothetical protein
VQDDYGIEVRENPGRGKRVALVVVLVLVALVVAGAAVGSLPAVCSSCHGRQADATGKSQHADMGCYGCHVDNGSWGYLAEKNSEFTRMYTSALLGRGLTQSARLTSRSACLECHSDVLKGVTSANGLSIKHKACAPGPSCDGCHSTTAHGKTVRWQTSPYMEDCIACHKNKGVSDECETCHTSESAERRDVKGPWQVTHGANWKKTHGMGDQSSCGTCHPSNFCARCHRVPVPHGADFGRTHGEYAQGNEDACVTCHKSTKDFCEKCHGMQMPHPAGFLKQHSSIAKSTSDARCIRCHVDTDCGLCHGYHAHPGGAVGVPIPWDYTSEVLRP